MSKPFFLTHHAASLMEDFARELNADAGLYLIHGDQGVGKTRLLKELADNRLPDCKVLWMDLQVGSSADGELVDSSALIEKTFARASAGDVIVADHFENTLKKSRHQLFLSWSTDGIDKHLSLIVCATGEYFDELKQMAQQYQVRMQSFQQLPLGSDEATAFLGFYLYPDRSVEKLSIPRVLRGQLQKAQGNFGKIIEIAERAGDQINNASTRDPQSARQGSRVFAAVSVAVLVAAVLGWYILGASGDGTETAPEVVVTLQPETAPDSAIKSAIARIEPVDTDSPAVLVDVSQSVEVDFSAQRPSSPSQRDDPVATVMADEPAEVIGLEDAESSVPNPEIYLSATEAVDEIMATGGAPEPGEAVSAEEQAEDSGLPQLTASEAPLEVEPPVPGNTAQALQVSMSGSQRLQRDLRASLDWISARERGTGTLQILLLSQARFDELAYYEYLARLAGEGVDVSQIRMFATYIGKREVLSVIYGEYPNRSAAALARSELPHILQQAEPVVRSVGGLKDEIKRLMERN